MLYQLKVLLWKNWKIFKRKTGIFSCAFELFLIFLFISSLSIRSREQLSFEAKSSEQPQDISNNFVKKYNSYHGYFNITGLIAFVLPKNSPEIEGDLFISNVMNDPVIQKSTNIKSIKFDNEKRLVDYVNNDKNKAILCGIVFHNEYTNYSIRIKGSEIVDPITEGISDYASSRRFEVAETLSWIGDKYKYIGKTPTDSYNDVFIFIQIAVDNAIIRMKTSENIKGLEVNVGKLSEPPIFYDSKNNKNSKLELDGLGTCIMFLIIGQVIHISNRLMEEKENKLKDGLISIGANPYLLWISWEIIYLPFSLFLIFMMFIFDPAGIMSSINSILYISLLILYTFSMYNLAVIVSLIIKQSKTVLVITCSFIACMVAITRFIYNLKLNGYVLLERIIALIFSPVSVSMAAVEIGHESDKDHYIGFSNMFDSEFGIHFMFVLIAAIAYFFIAIVLEYFSEYDFKTFGIKNSEIKKYKNEQNIYSEDIEEDPLNTECFVQVKNIYKFFKFRKNIGIDQDSNDRKLGKIFAANKNISFNAYKNEIFAILGHNGAGKSTLIQNMIGINKPDEGETYYQGLPISKNKKEIHKNLGICLQNNVLFESFTVADHFILYTGIKRVDNEKFNMDQWLKEIDLVEKKNYEVQHLSGGQKRKLCIGLALIGNPKYVFLDEPTTGLDPLSRRKIWSLLLKAKKDRVIFITTHYMDEADIIADRKLILTKGSVRCLGSSLYLKNHFKMKYTLEVETDNPTSINQLIQYHIPESTYFNNKTEINKPEINKNKKESENKNENKNKNENDEKGNITSFLNHTYTWKLPIYESPKFSSLLYCLEKEKGKNLKNFSLSAPLLEELFVYLNENNNNIEESLKSSHDHILQKDNINNTLNLKLPEFEKVERPNAFKTALRLCRYRLKAYLRQKNYLFVGILIPIGIFAVFLPSIRDQIDALSFTNHQEKEISSEIFKNQQWNYDINHSPTINDTLSYSILQQEFPKHRDQSYSLDTLTTEEMNEKGQHISAEPYYVSSFSGHYNTTDKLYSFSIYYNDSMVHSLPATLNTLSNAILSSHNINDTIHISSYPFDFFARERILLYRLYAIMVIAFSICFPLSFFGMNVVRERTNKLLKQLQLNGITNKSYWLSALISDLIVFFITCTIIFLSFLAFKFTPLLFPTILILLALFIVIAGVACLLFQYCLSYIFNHDSKVFLIFFLFNLVPSYIIIIKSGFHMIDGDSTEDTSVQYYLGFLILFLITLFPNYGISRILRTMINVGVEHKAINTDISFISLLKIKNQVITSLTAEIFAIIIYGYLLVKLTKKKYDPKGNVYQITEKLDKKFEEELIHSDEDILMEYKRIKNDSETNEIPIKVVKLAKEYSEIEFKSNQEVTDALNRKNPKYGEYHMSDMGSNRIVMTAFSNVSFGIDKCECFGILGPNGSGKSSLLNTTSFTFPQTLGDIYYDGKNTMNRKGNEITLGYCPQEDTLWNEYTLFEHIEMFLYLRGHSRSQAKKLAKEYIQYCRLTEHKNKMPYELSGGTRRKLNILIALCCSSTKMIMDEPSAGMDPSTRRYVWDIIKNNIQNNQSSTIMSTHSMEEAELLCNRIAIMIKGKLQCIGTPEHLKMKYGNTYILDVHTNDIEKFHKKIVIDKQLFGNSHYEREDKSLQRIKYEVNNQTNISRIFEIMESCRKDNLYTDYSYSQTSLEQVFLNFAKKGLKEN